MWRVEGVVGGVVVVEGVVGGVVVVEGVGVLVVVVVVFEMCLRRVVVVGVVVGEG